MNATEQIYKFLVEKCGGQNKIEGASPVTLNKLKKGTEPLGWFELIKLLIHNKTKVQGSFRFENGSNIMNITVKDGSYTVVSNSKLRGVEK